MNRSFILLCLAAALLLATSAVAEQFNYPRFTLPTNLVTLGTALVNGSTIQLTAGALGDAGLAYYPTKVSATLGFSTNFTWIPDTCDPVFGGGDGFAFFLTKNAPTVTQVTASSGGGLGIRYVPDTFMVGYSAYASQLYICDWTAPSVDDTFYYSPYCNVTNVAKTTCGGRMNVKITFDGATLTLPYALDMDYYYPGLSAGTGEASFRQSITQWGFSSFTSGFSDVFPSVNDLNYYGSAQAVNGKIRLTTSGSQSGAIIYNRGVDLTYGINTRFTWTPSNCDTVYDGADGFTFFMSQGIPTNTTVAQSVGSGLGIQYVSGVVMTAYSATFNEFYICNWLSPRPDSFRYVCQTVANPNPKLTCGANYSIEVIYSSMGLSMSVNGEVKISSKDIRLSSRSYLIGLSGATGQGYFQQDFSDWSFKTPDFQQTGNNFLLSEYDTKSVGSVSILTPIAQLTNGTGQSGAMWASVGNINYKFRSDFTWNATTCAGGNPTRGFAHYFSRTQPTQSQVQSTPEFELGIGNVPDVYMMGYDVLAGNLYICDWGAAPSVGLTTSICSTTAMPIYVCGTAINFSLTYDSFALKMYVNGVFKLSRNVAIYPRNYYGGFSASTGTTAYMTQQIKGWTWSNTQIGSTSMFDYGFTPSTPLYFGSAQAVPSPYAGYMLRLTNGFLGTQNAGMTLHTSPLKMRYGFDAAFYWNASLCDSVNQGGNGFAFVFTKAVPTNSMVLQSSGNGLGVQQVPNSVILGYSSYYNEFYICSWVQPRSSFRNNAACQTIPNIASPVHPQRYTCGEFVFFNLQYDGYSLRLNTNDNKVDIFNGRSFPLDLSSTYYAGLSGSVGSGYYEQESIYAYLRGFN